MTNKEKFLALVSEKDSGTLERNRDRIRNRSMLRESQQIALKVLMKLDELERKENQFLVLAYYLCAIKAALNSNLNLFNQTKSTSLL